ncbi:type II secretion system F family protein [Sandarakinorhabdus sp. AAP62]|uniref:type II secretion system F family protein n=1 Tax=Sandarakinorhabdus sp. AAP62 TaxID=1248916 RepID=UPI00030CB90E|nr:type II secretion system F family protein [Sandarakinorhabdus sp. AAP62]
MTLASAWRDDLRAVQDLLPARRKRLAARLALYQPVRAAHAVAAPPRRLALPGLHRLLDPLLGLDRGACVDERIAALPALLVGSGAAALVLLVLGQLLGLQTLMAGLGAAAAFIGGVRLWVAQRRDAGLQQVEEQFSLALGVIIRCVRAGLPVVEGMRAVGAEVPAPSGPEFGRCVDQIQLGVDFDEALAGLADRCRLADYRFFGVTVALQRQTGGNLAETLDNLAETIRRRRAVRLKAQSLTSEIRATVMVLALLPAGVAALMMVVSPNYILQLFTTESGRMLLGIAMLVQATGLVIIKLITRKALG